MNKGVTIFLIVFLSLLATGLVVLFVILLKGNFNFSFKFGYSDNKIESKTYDSIEDLKVYSNVADIFIEHSEDDKVLVELYSDNADEYYVKEANGNLEVKLDEKNRTFNFLTPQSKIVIKLPKDYDKSIKVDTKTSDIKLDDYENATLDIENKTGDLAAGNVKTLKISVDTGDIKINNLETINATVTTGDVNVGSCVDAYITTTTGDIKVDNITNKVDIKATTGDIRISNVNVNENSTISTTTGDVRVDTLTGAYVEATSKTGDIKVNNNDRKSEFEIKISTKTGDINVN